ncbi:MAG: hypothetical protein LBD37_07135, partial [Treponema sp.]|nr:hypothetical protein [Treponema sp.]
QYKAGVFSWIFSDPAILRELYGALSGAALGADIPITINTLEGVLFMNRMNDISFLIAGKLVVLIEHQSTINPNIPLRLLLYIARLYEKIVDSRNIYTTKGVKIPRPEFIVLYNGTAPCPDKQALTLSGMFEDGASLGVLPKAPPDLDLLVTVYNINYGRNQWLQERCAALRGYSGFIAKVREYEAGGMGKEAAVVNAAAWCIEHNHLKNFFEEHASEVMNMLMAEWNMDDALAVRYEEGLERGMELGLEQGLERGLERGREQGLEQGREEAIRRMLRHGMSPDEAARIFTMPLNMVMRYVDTAD